MQRQIVFIVYPGFQMLDLSGPMAAFEAASLIAGDGPFGMHVASLEGGSVTSSGGLQIATSPLPTFFPDTMIIVGGADIESTIAASPNLIAPLNAMASGARRIASVCTGAFILASMGQLDGRTATTHWNYANTLQRRFPSIRVKSDPIFIKDGNVWTSAGVTAGIDLALAMIEEDRGVELSRSTAQMLVVYHRRPGGQSQFSTLLGLEPGNDRIRNVLSFMREHLAERLSVEQLAEVACLSPRQFGRAFLAETGETPAKAVERLRAEIAKQRVEAGSEPIEAIARSVGFTDPERMRRAFVRIFGHPPQSMRRLASNETSMALH